MISFKKIESGTVSSFDVLLKAKPSFDAWAARTMPDLYANAQRERFMTEGRSEGQSWKPAASASYLLWKRRYFSSWAGHGDKAMIASSRLLVGTLPEDNRDGLYLGPFSKTTKYWQDLNANWGKEFRKVPTPGNIKFLTTVPYASSVNDVNDFTTFGPETKAKLVKSYQSYVRRAE